MSQVVPAIGDALWELDTPSLCLGRPSLLGELSLIDANAQQAGLLWRANFSAHLCPELAKLQRGAGAAGVSVASLSHAELAMEAGLGDILIRQPVVGAGPLTRLRKLLQHQQLACTLDHFAQAHELSQVCREAGLICPVWLELNVGADRGGIRAGWDAIDLAKGISSLPALQLRGIWGDLRFPPEEQSKSQRRINSAIELLSELRLRLGELGMPIECSALSRNLPTAAGSGLTEIQLSDVFGDQTRTATYFLLATVIGRPRLERAVLDIGTRHVGAVAANVTVSRTAQGRQLECCPVAQEGDDSLSLELAGPAAYDLLIGDKVVVECSATIEIWRRHSRVHVLQDQRVVEVWEIQRV